MNNFYVSPSLVIEYLFCPRFIYFMEILKIDQNEDKRFKVQMGREIHRIKSLTNVDYKRKKIDVNDKLIEQRLESEKYRLLGVIDEILFLDKDFAAPLDYKYAEYKGKIFTTYKTQAALYCLLIEDVFNKVSNKAYIVYTRSKNKIVEIDITQKDKNKAIKNVNEIFKIIEKNYYPRKTRSTSKCLDCCYRNICI